MKIKANGKVYEISAPQTVAEFISALGANPQRCVVELNGHALRFEAFKDAVLKDGDALEIMSIVAGG
ncbi:MAG: sulfur carrier protein ThiS [Opitutales bacterium]|nr:sulfur carrier protein ThiS [Opitutales bacterium]